MEIALLITFSLLFLTIQFPSTTSKPSKLFKINLIHGSSILSQNKHYNLPKTKGYSDDIVADLVPNGETTVFINFTIGQPPVPQLAVFDTGSSRIWVVCSPCEKCPLTTSPMLDPFRSLTYKELSCDDFLCPFKCENIFDPKPCKFWANSYYSGNIEAYGVLATDDFTMTTEDEAIEEISDVVFGCAENVNSKFRDSKFNGIFGFSYYSGSFLHRLGSRFSYCIGNLTNKINSYSQLHIDSGTGLGEGVELLGEWTPLQINNGGNYRVSIDNIAFDGKLFFGREAVIDTGAQATYLPKSYLTAVKEKIRNNLYRRGLREYEDTYNRFCFKGDLLKDLEGFPQLKFQFVESATLELDHRSLFKQESRRVFCLALGETKISDGTIIIGVMAQQNYHIAYDLDESKLYFYKVDCQYYTY